MAYQLALPRFVAFKGDNGQYLCALPFQNRPGLHFAAIGGITDPTVIMETIDAGDGNLRFKDTSSGKFWIVTDLNQNLVFADSEDTTNDNRNTLFRPFNVNSYTIALFNLGNSRFCRRYTSGILTSAFNANIDFTALVVQLKVEEPVSKREISNIKYDLGKSRVYDDETVVLVQNSAINRSDSSSTVNVNVAYKDVETSVWKTKLIVKLESKASFHVPKKPSVVGGKVELVDQPRQLYQYAELDETMITNSNKETTHEVVVPPRTKVVVSLTAIRRMFDVPFTFTQSDTLHNGSSFTTEIEGTYTGSCYYNLEFQTGYEPVAAEGPITG